MSTDVSTPKDFQQRMFERIRDQMGELMTEAELKALVETAVQKAFFEDVMVKDGYHDRKTPPHFVTLIKGEMSARVQAAVEAHIAANPQLLKEVLEKVIAEGFLGYLHSYYNSKLSGALSQFGMQVEATFVRK